MSKERERAEKIFIRLFLSVRGYYHITNKVKLSISNFSSDRAQLTLHSDRQTDRPTDRPTYCKSWTKKWILKFWSFFSDLFLRNILCKLNNRILKEIKPAESYLNRCELTYLNGEASGWCSASNTLLTIPINLRQIEVQYLLEI